MLQKISFSDKCCSFEPSVHLSILKNKMHQVCIKILGGMTVFNIDKNQECFLLLLKDHVTLGK